METKLENIVPERSTKDEINCKETKTSETRCSNINWKYVPIKAHYFFLFAGMGGTMPYMQVLAKDIGISPTAIGIIFTFVTISTCLAKPAFGFITDKFRNMRVILLLLLFFSGLSLYAILFIPPIKDAKVGNVKVSISCKEGGKELIITPPTYDSFCAEQIMDKQFDCELDSQFCHDVQKLEGTLNVTDVSPESKSRSLEFSLLLNNEYLYKNNCDCLKQNFSYMKCEPDFYKCSSFKNAESPSEYAMYNFWIFVLLAIISGAGSSSVLCLTDAVCYEILSDNPRQYGRQRLWATVSWGMTTFLSGYLNDVVTGTSKTRNYSAGFNLMLAFVAVDLLILSRIELKKAKVSTNIWKDVTTIFASVKTIVFALGVYICGILNGVLWICQFWYLTELGASQLLLGMNIAVQCLVAEVPFFFFSGWFIKKFGHFYCLIAALAAFSLRYGLYSAIKNPWLFLPVELLHGITFAIFSASMSLYAVDFAPPGTKATMLGIFGGLYGGLGVATGSFLGGIAYDNIGGRWTFFVAGMASLSCVPIFTAVYKFLQKVEGSLDTNCESPKTTENSNYSSANGIAKK